MAWRGAPKVWNDLPLHVRTINNTDTFKRRLKTYLFCKFYDVVYSSDLCRPSYFIVFYCIAFYCWTGQLRCKSSLSYIIIIIIINADADGCRPVTLVVAKCWDPAPKNYLSPRQEPVRPIDPSAWVAHTEAVRAMYGRLGPPPSVTGMPPTNVPATFMPSVPESSSK